MWSFRGSVTSCFETFLFCHFRPLSSSSSSAHSAPVFTMADGFDHVDGSHVSDDSDRHSAVQSVVGGTTYFQQATSVQHRHPEGHLEASPGGVTRRRHPEGSPGASPSARYCLIRKVPALCTSSPCFKLRDLLESDIRRPVLTKKPPLF